MLETPRLRMKDTSSTKTKHHTWQMISGQLAVTSHLTHLHMRCDNHIPDVGTQRNTNPTLSVPRESHYTNIDYLLWRNNDIEDPELDRDSYLWIIWCIWKAKNNKLFIEIDRDSLKTVWHADMLSLKPIEKGRGQWKHNTLSKHYLRRNAW